MDRPPASTVQPRLVRGPTFTCYSNTPGRGRSHDESPFPGEFHSTKDKDANTFNIKVREREIEQM